MIRRVPALAGVVLALTPALQAQQSAAPARAQQTVSLSLGEAFDQAKKNSPAYRQTLNDAGPANWGVRSAYGTLLPTFDVSSGMTYTGSGRTTFGGTTFQQNSPSLSSNYALSFNWRLSGDQLTATGQRKADRHAVDADIANALEVLRSDITFQYLTALQSVAQTEVARQQVQRNADFLALARARYQVGQATLLDVRQAEVQKGQSDVALLRAQQAENEAKLELFRRMGVFIPALPEAIALTDSFPVTPPQFDQQQLLQIAREENPSLRAFRARETAAAWSLRAAKSRFLPTISANASIAGYTQEFTNTNLFLGARLSGAQATAQTCRFQNAIISSLPGGGLEGFPNGGLIENCNEYANLDATGEALAEPFRQQLLAGNNVFPFSFTRQPFQASLRVSLPIFDGFSRNLQVSQARAAREDLEESVRARRLQVELEVAARYLGVQNNYQAIQVQEQNRGAAREQLRLAQDRYRLGAGSSLEVSDAQTAVARAETDYVTAVYEYHKAIALLELAVGRPLR
jgi:outer membrane protein